MNLNDFKRLIRPLQNKIFLLLGRAILKAIDNSEGTQKIQVIALSGETITGMERFQEYGFETYPFTEAEVAAIFLNGNRSHGIALCVHDRRYRPKDLVEGEVAVYTDEDLTADFRIWLKRDRILAILNDKLQITSDTEAYINSAMVTLGSAVRASVRKLVDERFQALFNAHVHSGVTAGGASTGAPTTLITDSHMTDRVRAI